MRDCTLAWFAFLLALWTAVLTGDQIPAAEIPAAATGVDLLAAAGIQGGLAVHVGCGDGSVLDTFSNNARFLAVGLDPDPAEVAAARVRFQSQEVYGRVTVDLLRSDQLPFIDNLVNLLIVEHDIQVSESELLRVLAPQGVLWRRGTEGWSSITKPMPSDYDQWTHYLHDATNNAVSSDSAVGPPRHYQWIGSPEYLRHHDHLSGLSAMVSAGGRIFYIIDLGPLVRPDAARMDPDRPRCVQRRHPLATGDPQVALSFVAPQTRPGPTHAPPGRCGRSCLRHARRG